MPGIELWIWIVLIAAAGVFQVLKRVFSQSREGRASRPTSQEQIRSYRPPTEDLEELRSQREEAHSPSSAMDEYRDLKAERNQWEEPGRALGGDPATEGERITVDLPPIPAATEGPDASRIQVEGPPPSTGPEPAASSVQLRRSAIASHRGVNPLRRRLIRSLGSRDGIRDAFVVAEVLGRPKGMVADDQHVERP